MKCIYDKLKIIISFQHFMLILQYSQRNETNKKRSGIKLQLKTFFGQNMAVNTSKLLD